MTSDNPGRGRRGRQRRAFSLPGPPKKRRWRLPRRKVRPSLRSAVGPGVSGNTQVDLMLLRELARLFSTHPVLCAPVNSLSTRSFCIPLICFFSGFSTFPLSPICDFPRSRDSSPFCILQCPQGLTQSVGTQVCGTDALWLVAETCPASLPAHPRDGLACSLAVLFRSCLL